MKQKRIFVLQRMLTKKTKQCLLDFTVSEERYLHYLIGRFPLQLFLQRKTKLTQKKNFGGRRSMIRNFTANYLPTVG